MKAITVSKLEGPEAITVEEIDAPGEVGIFGPQVLVDVHAVGVSFPDLLMSRGEYQMKPELPFSLGVDFAGTIRHAPEGSGFEVGQRVAGVLGNGGAQEIAVGGPDNLFPMPDSMSFDQGAALPMNYLTAHFALVERAQLKQGETVLIHGGAGGVGTATIQVARGYGARTIAVVSTEEKAQFAKAAGADEAVLFDGFLDSVKALTDGQGVDVVMDVVGGDSFTDSLRSLGTQGRLLVVGFASGDGIPEVKVNRLLLNNIDVRGVGWGAYAMVRPGYMRRQWEELLPMMDSGVIDPPIGETYAFEDFGQALIDMDNRKTLGKSVVHVR